MEAIPHLFETTEFLDMQKERKNFLYNFDYEKTLLERDENNVNDNNNDKENNK